MAFCDFVIRFNPEKDTTQDIAKRILYSIMIKRIKAKKPTIVFISGDSGEGKSYAALLLQTVLLELQGLNIKDYLDAMNVYIPIEYPQKIDKLLFDKELKKVNIITIHEAREVVKAKLWYSFLNQSISDINAMSRTIKRLIIMVISQFIRDIDTSVRYTITYYCKVRRPKNKPTRFYINVLWKDDRDLEKPKLRKRKLSGYLVYPNGKYRRFVPEYIELSKPSKEVVEIFEKQDREAKTGIIRQKIDNLMKDMQKDIGMQNRKVDLLLDWYLKHPDMINKIGKQYKRKWQLRPEIREMHNLSLGEAEEFESKLNDKLKDQGAIIQKEIEEDLNG